MFSPTNYVNFHHTRISFLQFSPLYYKLLHGWDKFNSLHHPQCLAHNMMLIEYFWNDWKHILTNKHIMHMHKYCGSTHQLFSFSLFSFCYWNPLSLHWLPDFSHSFHFSIFLAANFDHNNIFRPLWYYQKRYLQSLIFPTIGLVFQLFLTNWSTNLVVSQLQTSSEGQCSTKWQSMKMEGIWPLAWQLAENSLLPWTTQAGARKRSEHLFHLNYFIWESLL